MGGITARFRSLLCLGMTLALLVSTAAAGAHSLAHGAAGPVVGAGSAGIADPALGEPGEGPSRDGHDGGHDHLLSLSIPVAALFDDAPLVHPPLPAVAPAPREIPPLRPRPAEPPPADPPRTA